MNREGSCGRLMSLKGQSLSETLKLENDWMWKKKDLADVSQVKTLRQEAYGLSTWAPKPITRTL